MRMTTRRALSIAAIACFVLLAVALFIAHDAPAAGYELSLYSSTPLSVWVCLFLAFIGGIGIFIHQIATRSYRTSRFWLISLLILLSARVSLLYLPYIRGYVSWMGDNISHLGIVKDVLSTGHFSPGNSYPITHLFLSQITSITGIPDSVVTNFSTALLSVMFVLAMYLLATAILPRREQQLMVALLTAAIMFGGGYHVYVMPNGWSLLLLPLVFYCYFRRDIPCYRTLLVILLILYPFFHPLSALLVIVGLLGIELSKLLLRHILKQRAGFISRPVMNFSVEPLLIGTVTFLVWMLSLQQFRGNIRLMWQQITTGVGPETVANIEMSLDKINVHGTEFAILLGKSYGVTIIFLILSLLGIIFLLKRVRCGEIEGKSYGLFCFAGAFFSCGLLYLFYLAGMPGSGAIAGGRVLSYFAVFFPIFAAFALYELCERVNFKRLAWGGIICLVILSSFLSIRSLYSSPYRIQPNLQVTQMDMVGTAWFIEEKSDSIISVRVVSSLQRFVDGIVGKTERWIRGDITDIAVSDHDHFGYAEYSTLGEQYTEDKYATIMQYDRLIYVKAWHEVGRFNDADFERLEQDPTARKLYSNGEMDVFLIQGSCETLGF